MRVKSGVNLSVSYKARSRLYDCLKMFLVKSILIFKKAHTMREAIKNEPNFLLLMEKLEAFIALQYTREV